MGGVAHYCARVPAFAQQLMSAFWPGPLTLIVPRRDGVAAAAAGGQNSIGLRCPAHPVAMTPTEVPGVGEVISFTTLHAPPEGFRSPLHIAVIELEGGAAVTLPGAARGRPVVVNLWATWCGPCKAFAPVLEEFAASRAETLKVVKIDVDQFNELAREVGRPGELGGESGAQFVPHPPHASRWLRRLSVTSVPLPKYR